MTEPSAVITESAPVTQSETPKPATTWTSEQLNEWNRSGEIPKLPVKEAAKPVPESAPDKKPAVNASESAPETQKPSPKAEKRFQELANENRSLKERLEALEKQSKPESRETKQPSPAAPEYKPLDEKEFFQANPKSTYEDFVRAAAKHEAKWEAKQEVQQALAQERQRLAQEAAAKDLQSKMTEATKRYGEEAVKQIFPALDKVVNDQQIPYAVKAMLDQSDVLVDLLYTLSSDGAAFQEFLQLARTNPGAAIRKVVITEGLVKDQLSKPADKPKPEAKTAPETKAPAPPKPPAEVGGRGAAGEDPAVSAARSGNFSAFEAEQRRRARASQ